MTRRPPNRRPRERCLHLLLTLVLALSPLLAQGQVTPPAEVDGDASLQMPCHSKGAAATAHPTGPDCPHCADDAQFHLCHCGQAAPAGLIGRLLATPNRLTRPGDRRAMPPDPLPDSPDEALFRPPIPAHG